MPETGTAGSRDRRYVNIHFVCRDISDGWQITALLIIKKERRAEHPGEDRRVNLFLPTSQGNHLNKGVNTR